MRAVVAPAIASEQPSAVWLPGACIGRRLDATYYGVEFLRLDEIVRRHSSDRIRALGSLLSDPRRVLYMITNTYSKQELPDGVPFISGVDIDPDTMSVQWNSVRHVERAMCEQYPRGLLFDGALLIKVKGPNQLATYVERSTKTTLVSGTFSMAGVKDVDPWYLVADLVQDYAQSWRTRLRQNITVEFTPYDELAEIPVIVPDQVIQRAVGNKLRKAERLRQLAEDARAAFAEWLTRAARQDLLLPAALDYLWHSPDTTCPDSSWATDFDPSDRIDPWPHHVAVRTTREHLRKSAQAASLGEYFSVESGRVSRAARQPGDGDHHISVLHVGATGRINWTAAATERVDGEGIQVERGDVLFSLLNPKETRVAHIPEDFAGTAVASTEFAILRLAERYAPYPYLLSQVLRSPWVRVQSSFLTRSSSLSRRRLQENDLYGLYLPWDVNGADKLNDKLFRALDADTESGQLVKQADNDVKALIAGTCDKQRLLDESKQIEIWLKRNPPPNSNWST
jgi:hypothetical protein